MAFSRYGNIRCSLNGLSALRKESNPMQKLLLCILLALITVSSGAESGPFYAPIRSNDLPTLRKLVRTHGTKARDSEGNSPLMLSAAFGSLESMRLLLDSGANPNTTNSVGAAPLHWCANDPAKVRLLLAKGANVNARSKLGRTPLEIAVYHDGNIETARLLIAKGADVKAVDKGGASVLEIACGSNVDVDVARLLLEKGAIANTKDGGGFSPILVASAVHQGNGDTIKLLLAHGAMATEKCIDFLGHVKNGNIELGAFTALHEAASVGNFEGAEALIEAGADVEAQDIRHFTPLVWAVATDHPNLKIVQLLLAKGAKPAPAIAWAKRYRNPAILRLFGLDPVASAPVTAEAAIGPVTRVHVREALSKAFTGLQGPASNFFKNGGCVSCHAQNMSGFAVSLARPLGFRTNTAREVKEAATTDRFLSVLEQDLLQRNDPPGGADTIVHALLQTREAGLTPTISSDALAVYVAANQTKAGGWSGGGQQRAPAEDGVINITAKAVRVLHEYPLPGRKAEFTERIVRAAGWLTKVEPLTTEDRTYQILGLVWAGRKAPANRMQELIALQRAEGGWGQTVDLPADAYATAEALWALHEAGMASSNPVCQRGVAYLLRTQAKDGTWHVVSRSMPFQPYFESGFPYGHDQWISQTSTAYAAIALAFAGK